MTKLLRLNAGQVEETDVVTSDGALVTGLGSLTAAGLATGDLFLVIDVSDTSGDAGGTAKVITSDELSTAVGGTGGGNPLDAHNVLAARIFR